MKAWWLVLLAVLTLAWPTQARPGYTPVPVDHPDVLGQDLTLNDPARNRDIPLRVFLPSGTQPAPVILFSPGLGGNRAGYSYLAQAWVARGYVVVVLQHPGTDDSVWKGLPRDQIMPALKNAINLETFLQRVQDVKAVLDQLPAWNASGPFDHRLDLAHIGMAGHSYGAVTTQAVSGETFPVGPPLTDTRIGAALELSPSAPRQADATTAFGQVRIPWMLMTGTRDVAPVGDMTVEDRLKVFPSLPAGDKYQLVLDGAQHSAFNDRPYSSDKGDRNPNHHKIIEAMSTAFWDAYLRGDSAAKAWLQGSEPQTLLDAKDEWDRR